LIETAGMNNKIISKLATLSADFESVIGRPFDHFYCPILFRDEKTTLIQAHIVNNAFSNSSRQWTVQRKDVDNFFGTLFEADFTILQERGKHDLFDIISDKVLSRKLKPKILANGKLVEHYQPGGIVPESHSKITIQREGFPEVHLALKVKPSEMLNTLDASWEIETRRDLRLAAFVSLLKTAHLTLFELVGYHYALSSGGRFMGWDVLGKFFDQAKNLNRSAILKAAVTHFAEFVNLMRPMLKAPPELKGTISDGLLYLCTGTPKPWAIMVLIRTGDKMHAVLVPILEAAESAARFVTFLRNSSPRFEIRLARYVNGEWEVTQDTRTIEWPAVRQEDLQNEVYQ
jgi:hypothetical protein